MKTRNIICRGQTRTIEDAVESWKAGHDDAMEVRDIEDLVAFCLSACQFMERWYKEAWELALAGRLKKVQSAGKMLRTALDRSVEALEEVRGCVKWAEKKEYTVDNAREVLAAADRVKRMRDDLNERWPFLDKQQIEAARAELSRGDYQYAEDILPELQSTDPGDH